MKSTLYAAVAACVAMLATSGIVAFATAAPPKKPAEVSQTPAADLAAELDWAIVRQLADVKERLNLE